MGLQKAKILTVNAGSSSIKLAIYSEHTEPVYILSLSGLGNETVQLRVAEAGSEPYTRMVEASSEDSAVNVLLDTLSNSDQLQDIAAVGHRIVQAGPRSQQSEIITDELLGGLNDYVKFDPEHLPRALRVIETMKQLLPDIPHVACFDTAFFHDLPRNAQLLTIPNKYAAANLRRYGYHGLSYTYLRGAFEDYAGRTAMEGRVIYAHLGSGASLAATRGGKPVDTTMGFSPASGIMMSSRSGDIDPSLAWYMHHEHGMSADDFKRMVHTESGLLGVSGRSADMYTLLQEEHEQPTSADAVNLFVYQVQKAIGALTATIGGLDSLVFSGGMGEQSSIIRARVCAGLEYLGIELDDDRNNEHLQLISSDSSRAGVHVLPTDEAQVMCQLVGDAIGQKEENT